MSVRKYNKEKSLKNNQAEQNKVLIEKMVSLLYTVTSCILSIRIRKFLEVSESVHG